MTQERFVEIMEGDCDGDWDGDNAVQGLEIIAKYISPKETDIICGAGHDIIWSVNIDQIIEKGITEEDAVKLRELNWMVEDESYLACYV
jgi:hypothetical protein